VVDCGIVVCELNYSPFELLEPLCYIKKNHECSAESSLLPVKKPIPICAIHRQLRS
jgi:hypothetical protein